MSRFLSLFTSPKTHYFFQKEAFTLDTAPAAARRLVSARSTQGPHAGLAFSRPSSVRKEAPSGVELTDHLLVEQQRTRTAEGSHLMQHPQTVVFTCVIEPRMNWLNAAAILISSVREHGGAFAAAPFHLWVAGSATQPVTHYDGLNVTLSEITRDGAMPHLNKALALGELAARSAESDYIVLLDHDTVVLDLSDLPQLLNGAVSARRSGTGSLARLLGRNYVDRLGIDRATWSRVGYLNSGVVLTPSRFAGALASDWVSWTRRLANAYGATPVIEQLGLSVALALSRLPMDELATLYNQTNWRTPSPTARIIHYNDLDPVCRLVKRETLYSLEDFLCFLAAPVDPFWKAYSRRLTQLITHRALDVRDMIYAGWPRDWLQIAAGDGASRGVPS